MRMTNEEVRDYWDERARSDDSAQSTTQDYYLRDIEIRCLSETLARHGPRVVMDVGCGDARTTCALAQQFPGATFWGIDYSPAMIENAVKIVESTGVANVRTAIGDITRAAPLPTADLVYTTRCLINVTSAELQAAAIGRIHDSLAPGGTYVMIENFMEGHRNLNALRVQFGLPPIGVRPHNLFFDRQRLERCVRGKFLIVGDVNISSTYYLVSRVIYSRLCQDRGVVPDYFDDHHKYGALLPFAGEYGPVYMLTLTRV